jgi:hypothetical protein
MVRSANLILQRQRRGLEPPATCIVNDSHLRASHVCGKEAAEGRESREPVCADHLCQHRRSNGRRCKRTPLRLARGIIYPTVGWFPNTAESVNCQHHERSNCRWFINGTLRCPGRKLQGRDYCPAHAAALCQWDARDGMLCVEEAYRGSRYCGNHCWCRAPILSSQETPKLMSYPTFQCSCERTRRPLP